MSSELSNKLLNMATCYKSGFEKSLNTLGSAWLILSICYFESSSRFKLVIFLIGNCMKCISNSSLVLEFPNSYSNFKISYIFGSSYFNISGWDLTVSKSPPVAKASKMKSTAFTSTPSHLFWWSLQARWKKDICSDCNIHCRDWFQVFLSVF